MPNHSIVVIKFSKPADAAEFVKAYNGNPSIPWRSVALTCNLYFITNGGFLSMRG